jgi:hypothetical protein
VYCESRIRSVASSPTHTPLSSQVSTACSALNRHSRPPTGYRWKRVRTANRDVRDFGWEIAHAAVSRRPPISLSRIVPRTEGYTHNATVWDSSIVQGQNFCRAVPKPYSLRFATFHHRCTERTGGVVDGVAAARRQAHEAQVDRVPQPASCRRRCWGTGCRVVAAHGPVRGRRARLGRSCHALPQYRLAASEPQPHR